MKPIIKTAVCLFIMSCILTAAAENGGHANKGLLSLKPKLSSGDSINLAWSPTDSVDAGLRSPVEKCSTELEIQSIADNRPQQAYLGKCIGKDSAIVYIKGDFAQWIRQNSEKYLSKKCPDSSGRRAFRIECGIGRFDITESDYYNCSLKVDITVKNSQDSVLIQQRISASTRSWGRTFSKAEYCKVASNGVVLLISEILSMDVFRLPH